MIAVTAEVLWMCAGLPILRCCWFPRGMVAINVGVLGAVAAGVSVYLLAILVPPLRDGTCHGDKYEELCYRGLTKGIAVAGIRALVT